MISVPTMAPHDSSSTQRTPADGGAEDVCAGQHIDRSNMPLRIGSIFAILAASLIGAFLPLILAKHADNRNIRKAFFFFTSVGTGVILATAWMHLLPPALEALHSECLAETLGGYDWAMAIGLFTVITMFFIEIVASGLGARGSSHQGDSTTIPTLGKCQTPTAKRTDEDSNQSPDLMGIALSQQSTVTDNSYWPKHDAQADTERQQQEESNSRKRSSILGGGTLMESTENKSERDNLQGQLTTTFILEFGVLLHGVFIGLLMSTTNEPVILTVVFAFHQCFEGLGLGSRLATTTWPRNGKWWPYIFSVMYAASAPLATVVGLVVQPQGSASQLLVTGIFNSISAGILIWTGLVELLAREFLFDPEMQKSSLSIKLAAFGGVAFGACMMAVLARWA